MQIKKTKHDKAIGTQYYDIIGITNYDLERLYRLLVAEESRAKATRGFNRGSPELLAELTILAKERMWEIPK